MRAFVKQIAHVLRDDRGQDLAEYGLLLGILSIAALGALALFSPEVRDMWDAASLVITGII